MQKDLIYTVALFLRKLHLKKKTVIENLPAKFTYVRYSCLPLTKPDLFAVITTNLAYAYFMAILATFQTLWLEYLTVEVCLLEYLFTIADRFVVAY